MAYKNGTIKLYKGFTIYKNRNEWQATAYANPSFYGSNLIKVKNEIQKHLNK